MTSVLILFNTTYCIALWLTGVYYSVNCNSEVFICMPLKLFKNISTICEEKNHFYPAANSISFAGDKSLLGG